MHQQEWMPTQSICFIRFIALTVAKMFIFNFFVISVHRIFIIKTAKSLLTIFLKFIINNFPFVSGGYALVFLVKSSVGQRYALKRVSVNELKNLEMCKQEISILVSPNFVTVLSTSWIGNNCYKNLMMILC